MTSISQVLRSNGARPEMSNPNVHITTSASSMRWEDFISTAFMPIQIEL